VTIAISLKVNDGLVLAADSASTLMGNNPDGSPTGLVVNVYNHANKVANLRKGLPIGCVTWGAGSIGTASISTLTKDLRLRFTQPDDEHTDWHIDPESYAIEEVARQVREFMFDEQYVPATAEWPDGVAKPDIGFIVAGYSSGATGAAMAEEYQILIVNGECGDPVALRPQEEAGLTWNGQPEAITRLILGFGTGLPQVLHENLGVPAEQIEQTVNVIRDALALQLVEPAMPFQDAIDLADFLVDATIKVSRFAPGAPSVGGEIEIAAISKHEGFKWIRRKYYYDRALNPEEAPDADA
jgi:hypothetical protein